jgi:hypothetical protein
VEFEDRGRTYQVDVETGRVTFTDGGNVIPPRPEPTPELSGLALRVNQVFRDKFPTDTATLAGELAHAIDVTLAKAGGLGLKGQAVIDELRKTCDDLNLSGFIKGFPLGDMLRVAVGDDKTKLIPALKDAKAGLEAIK